MKADGSLDSQKIPSKINYMRRSRIWWISAMLGIASTGEVIEEVEASDASARLALYKNPYRRGAQS